MQNSLIWNATICRLKESYMLGLLSILLAAFSRNSLCLPLRRRARHLSWDPSFLLRTRKSGISLSFVAQLIKVINFLR